MFPQSVVQPRAKMQAAVTQKHLVRYRRMSQDMGGIFYAEVNRGVVLGPK